ncbi:hypothetical protein [Streptomyces microflavus]|uniref:hypothetical protein n=1 Tax=Streptomyces microflavus TaxID=1919 RepID=UPI003664C0A5
MTFESPQQVRACVRVNGIEVVEQLAFTGWKTWDDIPSEARQHIVRKLKAQLYGRDALCVWCSDLSIEKAYEPCHTCPTVDLTVWDGQSETRIPDPLARPVPQRARPYFLKLVAAAPVGFGGQACALMVPADEWDRATAERKLLTMTRLREDLIEHSGCRAADIRTFVWDGEDEIPFRG